jgi:hypothetical protein
MTAGKNSHSAIFHGGFWSGAFGAGDGAGWAATALADVSASLSESTAVLREPDDDESSVRLFRGEGGELDAFSDMVLTPLPSL